MRSYPNVHATIRLSQSAPALPKREDEIEIWLKGNQFHASDKSGRQLFEILGEITAVRGLGRPARTIEDIMDRYDAIRRTHERTTELYGDLATDRGWIDQPYSEPRELSAEMLAPCAEQIFSRELAAGLRATSHLERLGRECTEYRGVVEVEEDGAVHQNDVTRIISPPYLLFERTQATGVPNHYYLREILALEEGTVTDADVLPPSD